MIAEIAMQTPDVNWSVIIPVIITGSGGMLVVLALWDRIKRVFAAKVDFDYLKSEVHELRIRVATLEKQDGKLDNILAAIERRRRDHG